MNLFIPERQKKKKKPSWTEVANSCWGLHVKIQHKQEIFFFSRNTIDCSPSPRATRKSHKSASPVVAKGELLHS